MLQPIFYFEKLNRWDKVIIISYVALTGILAYFFLNVNSDSSNRSLLSAYTLGTQLFLYFIYYGSLRNLSVYFVWLLLSIGHLYLYYQLKDEASLLNLRGHAATGLRNTVILLLLFQLLRFISIKIQGQELVSPAKGGKRDFFDERNLTVIDYILFAVYFAATIFLN